GVEVVGGQSWTLAENSFQFFLRQFEPEHDMPRAEGGVFASSRNIAYRRQTWADVGGYPEWLTLAGEDALFNFQLYVLERKFVPNVKAVVRWPVRESARDYLKLCNRNGFAAGEARIHPYVMNHLRCMVFMLCPPLLLLSSRHRHRHFSFRYQKHAVTALGWLRGWLRGKRPPKTWKHIQGVLFSPEAQRAWIAKHPA
ncbi:MAG: hypothetical protein RL616_2069, partial [Verrucomicrobiota bacterium]